MTDPSKDYDSEYREGTFFVGLKCRECGDINTIVIDAVGAHFCNSITRRREYNDPVQEPERCGDCEKRCPRCHHDEFNEMGTWHSTTFEDGRPTDLAIYECSQCGWQGYWDDTKPMGVWIKTGQVTDRCPNCPSCGNSKDVYWKDVYSKSRLEPGWYCEHCGKYLDEEISKEEMAKIMVTVKLIHSMLDLAYKETIKITKQVKSCKGMKEFRKQIEGCSSSLDEATVNLRMAGLQTSPQTIFWKLITELNRDDENEHQVELARTWHTLNLLINITKDRMDAVTEEIRKHDRVEDHDLQYLLSKLIDDMSFFNIRQVSKYAKGTPYPY